jgi:hypothetical protein
MTSAPLFDRSRAGLRRSPCFVQAGVGPVPFFLLGYGSNAATIAAELGALAGLRTPFDVGLLMATVRRILGVTFPTAD